MVVEYRVVSLEAIHKQQNGFISLYLKFVHTHAYIHAYIYVTIIIKKVIYLKVKGGTWEGLEKGTKREK